jgi:hypothetical protein
MNNSVKQFLFSIGLIIFSTSSYSNKPFDPICEGISHECLFDYSSQLIVNSSNKHQNLTALRYIAVSASFNRPVPLEIYQLLPKKDLHLADSYYFAGMALYFGINGDKSLWKSYIQKSNSLTARNWASSFYSRFLTLNLPAKDLFIEGLFENGIAGYAPLLQAKTFYAIKTESRTMKDSITRDIINGDLDDTEKLKQLFSVISAAETLNNIEYASKVFKISEAKFSHSIFWPSFSASISAVHSTHSAVNPNIYLAMVEDTRFLSIVYSSVIDIAVTNGHSDLLPPIVEGIHKYAKSNNKVFDNNTAALLILKMISLMYII